METQKVKKKSNNKFRSYVILSHIHTYTDGIVQLSLQQINLVDKKWTPQRPSSCDGYHFRKPQYYTANNGFWSLMNIVLRLIAMNINNGDEVWNFALLEYICFSMDHQSPQ